MDFHFTPVFIFSLCLIALSLQRFTSKHCLQIVGLQSRYVVLFEIYFLLNKFAGGFTLFTSVETSYLNRDMCKFESSQSMKAEPVRLISRKLTVNL